MGENAFIFLIDFPAKVLMPVVRALGDFFFSPINDVFLSYIYAKILVPLGGYGLADKMANFLSDITVIDMIIGFGLPTILVISIVKWFIGIIM